MVNGSELLYKYVVSGCLTASFDLKKKSKMCPKMLTPPSSLKI
jgi:hypothetical protein